MVTDDHGPDEDDALPDERDPADGGGPPETNSPIDGQIVLLAGAKANLPAHRLPELLARVQADVGGRLDEYRRGFEYVHESPTRQLFLVPTDHWEELSGRLGFERDEATVVRRAHNEQLRRIGAREDRREEFETALEIRDTVVVGLDHAPERQG